MSIYLCWWCDRWISASFRPWGIGSLLVVLSLSVSVCMCVWVSVWLYSFDVVSRCLPPCPSQPPPPSSPLLPWAVLSVVRDRRQTTTPLRATGGKGQQSYYFLVPDFKRKLIITLDLFFFQTRQRFWALTCTLQNHFTKDWRYLICYTTVKFDLSV